MNPRYRLFRYWPMSSEAVSLIQFAKFFRPKPGRISPLCFALDMLYVSRLFSFLRYPCLSFNCIAPIIILRCVHFLGLAILLFGIFSAQFLYF